MIKPGHNDCGEDFSCSKWGISVFSYLYFEVVGEVLFKYKTQVGEVATVRVQIGV